MKLYKIIEPRLLEKRELQPLNPHPDPVSRAEIVTMPRLFALAQNRTDILSAQYKRAEIA